MRLRWFASAVVPAGAFLAVTALTAQARCGRDNYKIFVHSFESARDTLRARPQSAYNALVALRRHAEGCGHGEDRADVRYKLQLFDVGLKAYIGAADAERGHFMRGKATAQSALVEALALQRAHSGNAADARLADELVAQIKTPLEIIAELSTPAPKGRP